MAGFWNDATLETGIEPKRKCRWLFAAANFGGDETWTAKSVTKPSWNVSTHPHKFINHTFHYPGRVEWQPVEVTLVDVATPMDASANLLGALRQGGYNWPETQAAGSQTITKAGATSALGRVTITQIGSDSNDILDQWVLTNPFITDVKLGDLDYEGDDLVEVSFTIIYDYAYMTHAGSSPDGWAGGNTLLEAPGGEGKDMG